MNKKIIAAAAVIIVIIGVGTYFVLGGNMASTINIGTNSKEGSQGESIKTLLEMKNEKPQTCSYKVENEEAGSTSGTIYIVNGKMRIDTETNGKPLHILAVSNEFTYLWTNSEEEGIKMSTSIYQESGDMNENDELPNGIAESLDQKVSYTCKDWTVNETVFNVPTDITFIDVTTDMSDSMQSDIQNDTPAEEMDNQSACETCDELPAGEAQEACKTQMGCE